MKTNKKKTILPYNKNLVEKARYLRNNSTLSEVLLWKYLKGTQMLGFDFDRQKPILNYIVDFFSNELMLVIEIDGSSHQGKEDYDKQRQKELENLGISFLRFTDLEVKKEMTNVISVIENWIREFEEKDKPTPSPSQEGNF